MITNPPDGSILTAPASFSIGALASDSDGSVSAVEFYRDGNSLGVDNTSPYSAAVTDLAAGNYTFAAVATDNLGARATNNIALIVNALPVVSITNPVNGASFAAPANILVEVIADDPDGTINKVEFFEGINKLGEDASSPYSLMWSNVPAGAYNLTARATDNRAAVSTSSAITVTVTNVTLMPVTLFNPMWQGTDFIFWFESQVGRSYDIQWKPFFGQTNWQVVETLNGSGSSLPVTNQNATTTSGFYRVETK
jgi:hypothetical protein